jgi:hypothetical protein
MYFGFSDCEYMVMLRFIPQATHPPQPNERQEISTRRLNNTSLGYGPHKQEYV